MATEIAKAVNIDAKRVKVWDIEDMNPYHDRTWMHRRCTMIYDVPVRLRTDLPHHLRKQSGPTQNDREQNLVSKEDMERAKQEAEEFNQRDLDAIKNKWLKKVHHPRHHGPPEFQLQKSYPKTTLSEKFARLKNKIQKVPKSAQEIKDDEGTPEATEDVNVTVKTYLSTTRVMFHIVGGKDGVEAPKLDEVLYNMKRQLVQRDSSPLLQGKGYYTSRIVPSTFRVHLIGGHGSVASDSHDALGVYGFHAGVSPEEAHKMAEIANQIVVEEDDNKETAEGKWMLYKNIADQEANQLQEELKDERREMEKELRVDIDRRGDLDANTPRSIDFGFGSPRSFLDEEEMNDNKNENGIDNEINALDRLMDGETKEIEEQQQIQKNKEDQKLHDQHANMEAEQEAVQIIQQPAAIVIQAFVRGCLVRQSALREKNEILDLILSNCIVDLIEELEWLHEGEQFGHGGHGDVFTTDEALATNVFSSWTLLDAPSKEIRQLLVNLADLIVEEQGTELDYLLQEFDVTTAESAPKDNANKEPVIKGSEEYERLLREYLQTNTPQEYPKALTIAHQELQKRVMLEGRPLNRKQLWLRTHAKDLDPYSKTSSSQHDGPGSQKPRIDYRPWNKRRHRRTYWPEIAMLQGTFVEGRITGCVLVRFHDGAAYNGPWIDSQCTRGKHHRGTWKTPGDIVYIGSTVDHHFDVDHINGERYEVKYPFGETYIGPLLNGRRHGWGICKYSHGGEYVGQWWHDRRHGFGRMVMFDDALGGGVLYEGPWRHDKEHGRGRTRFPDGSSYEGEYRYGLWHGIGIRHYANGDVYNGDFKQSMRYGRGVLKYNDQRTYRGEFENDNRHGLGELVYPERHPLGHSETGTKNIKIITISSKAIGVVKENQGINQGETKENRTTPPTTSKVNYPDTPVQPEQPNNNIPNTSNLISTAVDDASAANMLAAEIARARAALVTKFIPPSEVGTGVLKYRGDWGVLGGEIYNGPFVDDQEHGEAQWIVPMDNTGGRMSRKGTWVEGDRLNWISYPISKEQTKAFVDAFHKPNSFSGLHAEMIADGFPHLPDGVDNTDPAVKMIVGGILRENTKTAGAAVVNTIDREKVLVLTQHEAAETELLQARIDFDDGKEELHEYLDDIDERREIIRQIKRDVFVLNRKVEEHWKTDDMNLRERYRLSVEGLFANPLKDWHQMRGMSPMKGPVSLVLEAMCIMLGLEPTFANAIVLFNDRDLNVKKGDRESIVLAYDVKLKDYVSRNRFNYFQLCTPNRLLAKPDSRPPLEDKKKGLLVNGKWIRNPEPPAKGIWRLRSYVENLEFRPKNLKVLKYGRGLGKIIEWVISSYKCACFVEQVIETENERLKLKSDVHYRTMELKEEEEEMWEYENNYRALSNDVVLAENKLDHAAQRLQQLQRVLDTVDRMRNTAAIPATLEDDVAVELLGTGNIAFHTRMIENVEPKTLWGGGDPENEDGITLKPGDFIDLYSPTSREVRPFTVRSVGNGEIHVNEEIYMVTEQMIHIRKRAVIHDEKKLIKARKEKHLKRQRTLTELLKTNCLDVDVSICHDGDWPALMSFAESDDATKEKVLLEMNKLRKIRDEQEEKEEKEKEKEEEEEEEEEKQRKQKYEEKKQTEKEEDENVLETSGDAGDEIEEKKAEERELQLQ